MSSSLVDGLGGRLCTICLNSVVDDNSRGKAELVCGHLFHLDCIGSEFNYRNEMKCPNCRVVENGEWLIPDEDVEDDEEYSLPVVNRRLELHIYSHGEGDNSPTSGSQNGGQETRLPMISPVVHYHHNTIVVPPSHGSNNSPNVESVLRAYGVPQGSDPTRGSNNSSSVESVLRAYGVPQGSVLTRRNSLEQVVPQDRSNSRPNVGEVMTYSRTRYRHNSPTRSTMGIATTRSTMGIATTRSTMDIAPVHQRSEENAFVHPNIMVHEPYMAYGVYNDPSLELRLNTNVNEDRSQGEQHEDQPAGH